MRDAGGVSGVVAASAPSLPLCPLAHLLHPCCVCVYVCVCGWVVFFLLVSHVRTVVRPPRGRFIVFPSLCLSPALSWARPFPTHPPPLSQVCG